LEIFKVIMLEWVTIINVSYYNEIINAEKLRVSSLGCAVMSQPVSKIKVFTDIDECLFKIIKLN